MSLEPAYLLDSDVLIWHLRGRLKTRDLLNLLASEGPLAASVLSVGETLVQARDEELPRTEQLLDSLILIPITAAEAKLAATLMRQRGPGLVDCHIGATALLLGIPLVTYNTRDYERIGVRLFDVSEW